MRDTCKKDGQVSKILAVFAFILGPFPTGTVHVADFAPQNARNIFDPCTELGRDYTIARDSLARRHSPEVWAPPHCFRLLTKTCSGVRSLPVEEMVKAQCLRIRPNHF